MVSVPPPPSYLFVVVAAANQQEDGVWDVEFWTLQKSNLRSV
jgi:hypothetical protein